MQYLIERQPHTSVAPRPCFKCGGLFQFVYSVNFTLGGSTASKTLCPRCAADLYQNKALDPAQNPVAPGAES